MKKYAGVIFTITLPDVDKFINYFTIAVSDKPSKSWNKICHYLKNVVISYIVQINSDTNTA